MSREWAGRGKCTAGVYSGDPSAASKSTRPRRPRWNCRYSGESGGAVAPRAFGVRKWVTAIDVHCMGVALTVPQCSIIAKINEESQVTDSSDEQESRRTV
ncbi:hypothetical protein Y032_0107g3833 [Ancylostoma ceylanicum]|uniref:Uncharacterized protein n=1 Tax=Ancylostoma ceylanicum TaxID=53326 RepID=A0A016TEW3_9BILA|nr:hypothetical protein Y032_0107g3833 [Ancylostoma ceylanicum]